MWVKDCAHDRKMSHVWMEQKKRHAVHRCLCTVSTCIGPSIGM